MLDKSSAWRGKSIKTSSAEAELRAPVSFSKMIRTYDVKKGSRACLWGRGEGCRQQFCKSYAVDNACRNQLPIEILGVRVGLWHQHSGLEHSAGSNSAIVAILVGMCPRDVRRCWRGQVSIFDARGARECQSVTVDSSRPCHQARTVPVPSTKSRFRPCEQRCFGPPDVA